METKSGRSSRVSNRSTSSSCLSRPGSAVDLLLERMGAIQADNRESMAVIQANIGAAQADTRNSIEAMQANMGAIHADLQGNIGAVQENIGAVGAAQVELEKS